MLGLHLVAYLFAGTFFANFVPHFVSGVLGRSFPTPFASPPFRGQSSAGVNVMYGLCNLAVAYALLAGVGAFEARNALHAGAFGLGFAAWSLMMTRSLGRLQAASGCDNSTATAPQARSGTRFSRSRAPLGRAPS